MFPFDWCWYVIRCVVLVHFLSGFLLQFYECRTVAICLEMCSVWAVFNRTLVFLAWLKCVWWGSVKNDGSVIGHTVVAELQQHVNSMHHSRWEVCSKCFWTYVNFLLVCYRLSSCTWGCWNPMRTKSWSNVHGKWSNFWECFCHAHHIHSFHQILLVIFWTLDCMTDKTVSSFAAQYP